MANQRVGRSRFPSSPRRQTQWGGSTTPQTGPKALAAASAQLFGRFTAASLEALGTPVTVIRNRGVLSITSDQFAAGEDVHGAIGICVVSDQAAAAGVSAILTPITESDWDGWLMWMPFVHSFVFGDATGFQGGIQSTFHYDSKGMRKITDNESLVLMIENQNSTDGLFFNWVSRTLFKLH